MCNKLTVFKSHCTNGKPASRLPYCKSSKKNVKLALYFHIKFLLFEKNCGKMAKNKDEASPERGLVCLLYIYIMY